MSAMSFDASEAEPNGDAVLDRQSKRWDSVYHTLTTYLQDGSTLSLDDAVDQVIACWDETTKYTAAVFTVPVCIAKETPYDSPRQKKLAEFMLALDRKRCEIHPPLQEGVDSLRNFSIYVYDHQLQLRSGISEPEDVADRMAYASLCAFVANMVYSDGEFQYSLGAIALDDVTTIKPTASIEERDAFVIGAAQFIIYQAPAIFNQVLKDRRRTSELAQSKGCLARLGFSKRSPPPDPDIYFYSDSWQAWRRAFGDAAADETLDETCRQVARKAADIMALQEKMAADASGK